MFGTGALFQSDEDEAYLPAKMRGQEIKMVGNGKQLEGFESKVKKPAEEQLKTSAKPSGEQLDLIEEESDEEDEDIIIEKMIENKLFA